jgi:hypothetical protein
LLLTAQGPPSSFAHAPGILHLSKPECIAKSPITHAPSGSAALIVQVVVWDLAIPSAIPGCKMLAAWAQLERAPARPGVCHSIISWPLPCFVVVSALSSVSHDTQHRVCRCCVECLIGTALGDVSRMPVQLSVSPLRDQVLDVYLGKACKRWQLLRPSSSSMCSRHHFSTLVCMQCRP